MSKFWLIFKQEYKRHVFRKRFLFAILSVPLFIGVIALVGFLSVWLQYNRQPAGYVDAYQILSNPVPVPKKDSSSTLFPAVEFIAYPNETAASEALNSGAIQGYFVLSADYLKNGSATFVKSSKTGTNVEDDFSTFLSYNLLSSSPKAVATRLSEGNNLIVRSADGSRELSPDNWMAILLPFAAGLLFFIAVNISGGYLLQAVVEEKENRTMEIIITSVSPTELMAGKVLADLLIGLTQLAIWIFFIVIAVQFVPSLANMSGSTSIDASSLLLMAAVFLPAFVMVSAAMGAVGATASEAHEAQQIAGLFTIPLVIPFWFITPIMLNPNGGIAVFLSMFPLTAPISMPLRFVFTNVPLWQIVVTIAVLCVLAAFAVWSAGKIFHLGMLRYGKRLSFRELFQKA
jgi:ABC-2 type transport system permease protein